MGSGVYKVCKGCGASKPLNGFYPNSGMRDGYLSWCKPCVYTRYGESRSRRQSALLARIQEVKVERGCADCGYNAHPAALDFDHLPGHVKSFRMASAAAGIKWSVVEAEMAKCEVVCANCHRIRTADRRSLSIRQEAP